MQQKNQYYYLVISLLFFSSCLCIQNLFAANSDPDILTTINVYSDQPEFEIILNSNPTTGYKWYLTDIEDELIFAIRSDFMQNKKSVKKMLIGAGGTEKWRFRVNNSAFRVPRLTTISFQYLRPWQINNKKPAAPNETITYTILINPFKKP